jgi:deoxycytidylate deaminase
MAAETVARQIVLGLTGPIGSGVSTAAETLESKLGFRRIRLSTIISTDLEASLGKALAGSPDRRVLLQDHGNARRESEGRDYWVKKALEGGAPAGTFVVEGVRNIGEVDYLRERFHWFFLFAMDAPKAIRWDRVREQYQGNEAAFERDDKRDTNEDDKAGQQVGKCVSDADYLMKNHDSIPYSDARHAKLAERFGREIGLLSGSSPRRPDPWEIHMATAYAQSLGSECIKRNVGAVVVDPAGIALSLGYNENPVQMRPCKYAYSGCFKDQDMGAKLERMRGIACPKCGTRQDRLSAPWLCCNGDCREDLKLLFFPSRNMELCTALHAEERAIRGLPGGRAPGATMYVTTCPCFQCSRYIVETGIKQVFYVEAYPVKESIDFLMKNGVTIQPFEGFKARAYTRLFKGAE